MDPNSPLAVALFTIAGLIVGLTPAMLLTWWLTRRESRRIVRESQLRHQLWELEQQIREEAMSDEEREWYRQYRQRQAEIRREARRRLGLPEDEEAS